MRSAFATSPSDLLYRPEDFEPLIDERWDEARIRAGIEEIVADTDAALRGPKLLWPAEVWDGWRATSPLKDLYCGAAGVLWALAELCERGHAETGLDLGDLALRVLERARRFAVHALGQVRRQRTARGRGRYSLFTGDPGVALYLASCLDADAAFPVLDA